MMFHTVDIAILYNRIGLDLLPLFDEEILIRDVINVSLIIHFYTQTMIFWINRNELNQRIKFISWFKLTQGNIE